MEGSENYDLCVTGFRLRRKTLAEENCTCRQRQHERRQLPEERPVNAGSLVRRQRRRHLVAHTEIIRSSLGNRCRRSSGQIEQVAVLILKRNIELKLAAGYGCVDGGNNAGCDQLHHRH